MACSAEIRIGLWRIPYEDKSLFSSYESLRWRINELKIQGSASAARDGLLLHFGIITLVILIIIGRKHVFVFDAGTLYRYCSSI